jgi:hypothetical protein
MYTILLTLFHQVHPDADPFQMSIAEISLDSKHQWLSTAKRLMKMNMQ